MQLLIILTFNLIYLLKLILTAIQFSKFVFVINEIKMNHPLGGIETEIWS